MASDKKYYNVRRFKNGVDMGVIDIPGDHLELTLKNHPDWVNLGEVKVAMEVVAPPNVAQAGFPCPICGNAFGSEKALQAHKFIHQPTMTTNKVVDTVTPKKHHWSPKKNVKKTATKRKRKAA